MKENLHFQQLQLNYISNRKKKKKNEPIKLEIACLGVHVVTKTDDEVYVLSIIKINSYFSFVFSIVPKKIELLKISKVT